MRPFMILKYLPNTLTLMRLLLVVPFLVFFYHTHYQYAFYTFLIAGFTDGLDGWLARAFHWQSDFGSAIDPIADKLLITASFIALALTQQLPWWLVALVFLRDLTISIGVIAWYSMIQLDLDFKPTYLSKINTVLQLGLITFCLFSQAFAYEWPLLLSLFVILTTLTTLTSYIDYVWTWGKKAYLTTAALK